MIESIPFGRTGHHSKRTIFGAAALGSVKQSKADQILDVLLEFGIIATRIQGLTGVWAGEEKIAAQGVRISRWVTMHGFALNVNPDLSYYDGIIPCGIFDHGITSMEELLGKTQDMKEVKSVVIEKFNKLFMKR